MSTRDRTNSGTHHLGEPVEKHTNRPSKRTRSQGSVEVHHNSFAIGEESFSKGDFVVWGGDDDSNRYLGMIRAIFTDERGRDMVRLQPTFLLASDPFTRVRGVKVDKHEAYYVPAEAVHPIGCVRNRCYIVGSQAKATRESRAQLPVYYCVRQYSKTRGVATLSPVDLAELAKNYFDNPETSTERLPPVKTKLQPKVPLKKASEKVHEANDSDGSSDTSDPEDDEYHGEHSDSEEETDDETLIDNSYSDDDNGSFQDPEEDNVVPKSRKRKTPISAKSKTKKPRITARKTDLIYALPARAPITPVESGFEYTEMRKRLHVSAVPDTLPCRENELAQVIEQLETAIEKKTGCCIYISGVPGTGKTATVREALRFLQARSEAGEMQPFYAVEINGMKLTEPQQSYSVLWEALTDTKVTSAHAAELLETRFKSPRLDTEPIVVVMDELDLLVTSKQNVIYSFFDWPNRPNSNLIVVAIANTMDLPERLLTNRVSSRLGLKRMNFQPYTYQQLSEIVQSRLIGIDIFDKEAIEFASRKVSAVSGDARRALDICRRAVELVEREKYKAPTRATDDTPLRITIRAVQRAVTELFTTSNVSCVQKGSLHQKIFLIALANRVRRRGVPDIELREVIEEHRNVCLRNQLDPPMHLDFIKICYNWASLRIVVIEGGPADVLRKLRFNNNDADVSIALKNDERVRGYLLSL